jgi:ABC-type multidrug transport system fused ATPase/permease subunit
MFAYSHNIVLKDLALQIKAGERIAVIGPSGSGKSTLVRLLVRAADPTLGDIFIEGRALSEYTLASLRSAVCYVPQHSVLFQGSVRENLLYGDPNASAGDLERAIEVAQFTETVKRLSQGLDTQLGPGAVNLSGGERQRLAIARSLLRKSAVLIFDESTSALDAPTEHLLLSSVANLDTKQTFILISHRVSSVAWVDRFILLDGGEIIKTGTHQDLYAQSPLYRSLYDASLNQDRPEVLYR